MAKDEYHGTWQADGNHEGPVEGRLVIDDAGRPSLQLRRQLPEAERMTGRLSNDEPVTLFGTRETRRALHEHYVQDQLVSTAVIGLDLASDDEPCLTGATVKLDGLAEAVGISGLSIAEPAPGISRFLRVEWEATEPIKVLLPQAELRLTALAQFHQASYFQFELNHGAQAALASNVRLSLREVHRLFSILSTFVAFATEAQVGTPALLVTKATEHQRLLTAGDVFTHKAPVVRTHAGRTRSLAYTRRPRRSCVRTGWLL
jgi:hypothetical protein